MTGYFSKFPLKEFDVDGSGIFYLLTNIVHRVKIRNLVKNNLYVYDQWILEDGDSPETIAHKYYGSTKYYWIVMMCNDVTDPYFDWLMSYNNFIAFIKSIYGSVEASTQLIHHYEDLYGNYIDFTTYDDLADNERLAVNCYDYYNGVNESKRTIKLLEKVYLGQIEEEIDKLLSGLSE